MKTTDRSSSIGLTALATCCAVAIGMSTSAMASVEHDQGPEGVKSSAANTVIPGEFPPKSGGFLDGGFLDQEHSAEGDDPYAPSSGSGNSIATSGSTDRAETRRA